MFLKRLLSIVCSVFVVSSFLHSTNIIIIAVDTLRADHLSCYGYPRNTSPNIDKFAKDSVKFNSCYTPVPKTGPAFTSMLSSLPPYKHGAKRNGLSLFDHVKLLPEILREHEYYSSAFVSIWSLRDKLCGLGSRFDSYTEVFNRKMWAGLVSSEGKAPKVNKAVFNWLGRNSGKKFFLWVHYTEPHLPYVYHKKFDFGYNVVYPSFYAKGSNFRKIKQYDTEVSYVDHYIGELIEKIKELGLYEDSLIIFVADHGEGFGEHNYYGHGRILYNSTLHIPLIVKLPGNADSNSAVERNVSLMDVAPSILSCVNIPVPEEMEGEDLFEPTSSNRVFYFETYGGSTLFKRGEEFRLNVDPIKFGMLKDGFKLIFGKKYEAYDVGKDKFELNNIYKNPDEKMNALSDLLKAFIREVNEFIELTKKYHNRKSKLSKEDIKKLKALGYIK